MQFEFEDRELEALTVNSISTNYRTTINFPDVSVKNETRMVLVKKTWMETPKFLEKVDADVLVLSLLSFDGRKIKTVHVVLNKMETLKSEPKNTQQLFNQELQLGS